MKKLLFFLGVLVSSISVYGQTQTQYNVTSGNGNGLRFWNSDSYKIHMGNSAEYKYGPVTDYSIKMNMSNTAGRGWTWGVVGLQPIAALNTQGDFQIAKSLRFDGGGGFFMSDNSWIRTYGNKNFYHNTGTMRTDGTFQVGPNGNRFIVNTTGNVGVGITNPSYSLHIKKAETSEVRTESYNHYAKLGSNSGGGYLGASNGNGDLAVNIRGYGDTYFNAGNVGIGTTTPDAKLAVNGNIHTKEVKVDLIGWADYVFADDYKLPTLEQVENHITEKGHLINIPSATEVAENGIQLGEMNAKLLEKIEELTLYTIAQEKKLKSQENRNNELEQRLYKIEKLLNTKK